MDNADQKTVAQERFTLDGVAFSVRVLSNDQGFHARWRCTLCDQVGQSTVAFTGEAAASCWARGVAAVHRALHDVSD